MGNLLRAILFVLLLGQSAESFAYPMEVTIESSNGCVGVFKPRVLQRTLFDDSTNAFSYELHQEQSVRNHRVTPNFVGDGSYIQRFLNFTNDLMVKMVMKKSFTERSERLFSEESGTYISIAPNGHGAILTLKSRIANDHGFAVAFNRVFLGPKPKTKPIPLKPRFGTTAPIVSPSGFDVHYSFHMEFTSGDWEAFARGEDVRLELTDFGRLNWKAMLSGVFVKAAESDLRNLRAEHHELTIGLPQFSEVVEKEPVFLSGSKSDLVLNYGVSEIQATYRVNGYR